MANFRMEAITRELRNVEEKGITFEDKMQTWDTADDVKDVVRALKNTRVVNYLKLDGNTLGVKAAEAIGDVLKMHPEMRKALWKNMFTRRSKAEIPIALQHLSNGLMLSRAQLTVLDLSDNALGPNGMVGIKELLRSPVCYTLQDLLLNNCGLGPEGGQMLSSALIDCYNASVKAGTTLKLKTFITGRNRLENEGATAISKIFSTVKTLELIAMPQNSIYSEGMSALAEGIAQNPNLQIINLNDNTMGVIGATSIADALCHTPKLREMNFGDCLLKTDGAYALATVLDEIHHDIEVVDLSFNEIGADGGVALAGVLSNKPHIKRINIDGNQFGDEGCVRIRDIMRTSPNPNVLDDFDEDEEPTSDVEEVDEDEYCEEQEKSSATEKTNGNAEVVLKGGVKYGNGDDTEDWEDADSETVDEEHDDVYERGNDTTEEVNEEDSQDEEDDDADDDDDEDDDDDDDDDDEDEDEDEDDDDDDSYTGSSYSKNRVICSYQISSNDTVVPGESEEVEVEIEDEPTPAEIFCLHREPCSLEMFTNIEGDKLKEIREIFDMFEDDNQTLVMIYAALKCAHLADLSTEALSCSKALFHELFEHATKINQEIRIMHNILIHVGAMKAKEPFQPIFNIHNCHSVLRETLRDTKITSSDIRKSITLFIGLSPNESKGN